jgi:hypothetical protein
MTDTDQKTLGTWMPFAPIAIAIVLIVCAVAADRDSIATYNDAQLSGVASAATELAVTDKTTLQVSSLRK